jgi:hypothetical protein
MNECVISCWQCIFVNYGKEMDIKKRMLLHLEDMPIGMYSRDREQLLTESPNRLTSFHETAFLPQMCLYLYSSKLFLTINNFPVLILQPTCGVSPRGECLRVGFLE